jgi:hypothetical protein
VPIQEGRIRLGTWQQIVFIDFDVRPRRRKIVVQILGESGQGEPAKRGSNRTP